MTGDFGDQAQDINERHTEESLKVRKPAGPPECGICHYCEEPIIMGRWCDTDCRDAWEAEQKQKGGV